MQTHSFTLVLDRQPTEDEQDAIAAASDHGDGTDAVPEFDGPEPAVVHFDRESDTVLTAVTAAVLDIESAGLGVVAVTSEDLVTLQQVATRVGRSRESVRLLSTGGRGPGGFPPALSSGSGWALYSWAQVQAWFVQHHGMAPGSDYDRQLAAADHLVRARSILGEDRVLGKRLLST